MKMRELQNSKVYYDNPNKIYKPADYLTGRVEINLYSSKTVKGIYLSISGKALVSWSENESTTDVNAGSTTNSVSYTNSEQYFKEVIYVIGDATDSTIELPAGKHVYPFKYLLPSNLPPSFDTKHSIGKIIYKVKATLVRSWKMNKYVEEPFIVETTTIQDNPQIKEPQILQMEKQFGLIFKSKPLNVTVKTPHSGFRLGDTIHLAIEVNNRSDTIIKNISVKFREIITYYATAKTRTDEKTLSKNHIMKSVGANTTTTFNHTITVPTDLVLQDLTNCKIIDLIYGIKVELHTFGLTKNLVGIMNMIPIMT